MRVVRTSTMEVDHRMFEHYRTEMACVAWLGGAVQQGTIHDISEGGATLVSIGKAAAGPGRC